MAKQLFGKFVKITGAKWAEYQNAQLTGNIVFADLDAVDSSVASKLIWANGIEYNIADNADILERLSAIDSSLLDISTWKENLILQVENNVITIDDIEGSVTVTGEDYIDVSTIDGSINIGLSKDYIVHGTDEQTTDDIKLTTKKYVDDALAGNASNVDASVKISDVDTALINIISKNGNGDIVSDSSIYVKTEGFIKIDEFESTDGTGITISASTATTGQDISDSSTYNDALTSAVAVKEYVKSTIGGIANALTFEGGIQSLQEELKKDNLTEDNIGDMFVADSSTTITIGSTTINLEVGDSVIVKEITNGAVSGVTVVEKNLTGAVTTSDIELTQDKIIVGAGNGSVKTTYYTLGEDTSSSFGVNTSVLATEQGVKEYVDGKLYDVSTTIDTSTSDYINIDTTEDVNGKEVNISANIVKLEDASDEYTGLADAYDVKQAIHNAAGTLSVEEGEEGADIVFSSVDSSSSVLVRPEAGSYVSVKVEDDAIVLDVSTATLADVSSNNVEGLALAQDVYNELVAIEETVATAINTFANNVGVEEDFSIDWTGVFEEGTTIVDAIKALKAGEFDASVVNTIGGKSGDITLRGNQDSSLAINLTITDGGEIQAEIVDISNYIADKIGNPIHGIDVSTGNFLNANVSEVDENGKVTIDASIQYADDVNLSGIAENTAEATGVATDAYVKDAIMFAMAWEVIE